MNKDNYKRELDNVKPDEKLVRNTISMLEERQEKKKRIFTFQKLAIGFCSILVIGGVGYTYYSSTNDNTIISSGESNKQYAVSTTYNIEEKKENVTSNISVVVSSDNGAYIDRDQRWVPSKRIGFDKETEKTFTGMYLISQSDNTNWKNYRHTKEYSDFKTFVKMLDSVASEKTIEFKRVSSYKNNDIIIYDTYGKSYATKNTMRVKIGNKYMIYLPVVGEDTIVVQLLSAEQITVYEIKRDMSKEDEYIALRDFIKNTGREVIEDEQESIDRNVRVYVNGKEDKTRYYDNVLMDENSNDFRLRYTQDKKLIVTFKDTYKKEISDPKVKFNKDIELSTFRNNVKDIMARYLGKDSYAYIIILTKNDDVYYIQTSKWVKEGQPSIIKVASGASSIERGNNSNGESRVFAIINGKKQELNIQLEEKSYNSIKYPIDTNVEYKTSDIKTRYDSETGRIYATLYDTYKKEISNPKVELNKEIEISLLKGKVKGYYVSYVGKDSYPYIIVLTTTSDVYYIKTSEWVKTGTAMIEKVASNVTKVEIGSFNGIYGVYATINGEKVKLDIK